MGCKLKRCNTITQNFKYNIKLTGITKVYFAKSEWENLEDTETLSWQYLLYRGFFLAYFIVFLSHSIYRDKARRFWLLMATHWSLLVQTLYGIIFFANLSYRFYRHYRILADRRKDNIESGSSHSHYVARSPEQLNIWDSITWLLLNFTGTFPYIVTFGYWGFVYFGDDHRSTAVSDVMLNLTVHGFNAVLALMDIFIIAIPVRIAHAVYTVLFTFIYLLFSMIYEYSGGQYKRPENPYIYKVLNWRDEPEWTVLRCILALIAAFFFHIVLWFLYRMRLYVVSKYPCQRCYSSRK